MSFSSIDNHLIVAYIIPRDSGLNFIEERNTSRACSTSNMNRLQSINLSKNKGKYTYTATAAGYNPVSGQLNIDPGITQTVNVFLPTSMVTYKWSVTPTTITDKYDITLDMTFRTDVPAPALINM